MTPEQLAEKEPLNPENLVRDIIVSLGITTKEAYEKKLRVWKSKYDQRDSLLAALSELRTRLRPTTEFSRRFEKIYGGSPSLDYIIQLIDPNRTLTDQAREGVKKIWRS